MILKSCVQTTKGSVDFLLIFSTYTILSYLLAEESSNPQSAGQAPADLRLPAPILVSWPQPGHRKKEAVWDQEAAVSNEGI